MEDQALIDIAKKRWETSEKRKISLEKEQREGLSKYFYTIALYAAGTISLSITFLSTLITNYFRALSEFTFLGFSNIYFLYLSWCLLLVTIISGLLSRKYYAFYIQGTGFMTEAEAALEVRKRELLWLNNTMNRDVISESNNLLRKEFQEDIDRMRKNNIVNEKKIDGYFKLQKPLSFICQFFGLAALVILLIFTISVSQAVIQMKQDSDNSSYSFQSPE